MKEGKIMNHLSTEKTNAPIWFIFRQNELLVEEKEDKIFIPRFKDLESVNINPVRVQMLLCRGIKRVYRTFGYEIYNLKKLIWTSF